MIVVDASVMVDLVLGTERAAAVVDRLSGETPVAPAHLEAEVVGVMRRLMLRGDIDTVGASTAVGVLAEIAVQSWDLPPFSARVLEIAHTVAVADGYYVALAEMLEIPLLTFDARLSRSHGHGATIELLSPT